jgi:hypothetical protein
VALSCKGRGLCASRIGRRIAQTAAKKSQRQRRHPADCFHHRARADYLQRICAAFDFGVFPEETDWAEFAGWRDVFDRFPLPDSPGYHAFRRWYGWEPVPVRQRLGIPPWKVADLHEGRVDPCEEMV